MSWNNYPFSVYRFNDTINKCVDDYEYCMPVLNTMNTLALVYGGSSTPMVVPLPCDYVYGDSPITDGKILDWIIANPTSCLNSQLGQIGITDVFHTKASPPSISAIWNDIGFTGYKVGMCVCYFFLETDSFSYFTILGKSQCLQVVGNTDCNVVQVTYSNNSESLGLPIIPQNYTAQYWGKLWKPQLKSTGRTYTKSNGELIVVSSRSDEIWQLDINMMNYEDIRNLTLALKSDKVIIYNLTGAQFGLPSSSENTQFYLEEDITIPYSNKCFASARISAKLRLKSPVGFINYNC